MAVGSPYDAADRMLKQISLLGWLIIAVLLIEAGMDLRRQDLWGAARMLVLVAVLPWVFRSNSNQTRPPGS